MKRGLLFSAAFVAVLGASMHAQGAEPQPGDACAAADQVTHVGGPENPGTGYDLVCDGAHWQAVRTWASASGRSLFQVNTDTGSCTAAKLGRLRYDGVSTWEYCDGTTWKALSAALSSITAATGANTIASGDNAQAWNWTLTTAAKSGITFGETAAATSGVGAQSVVKMVTAASSTAMPLWIVNAGAANSFEVDDQSGGDTSPFVIDASGNVGIGTAAPLTALHVVGTSATTNITVPALIVQGQTSGTPSVGEGTEIDFYTKMTDNGLINPLGVKQGDIRFWPSCISYHQSCAGNFAIYGSHDEGGGVPLVADQLLSFNDSNGYVTGGININKGAGAGTASDSFEVGTLFNISAITYGLDVNARSSGGAGNGTPGAGMDFYLSDANYQQRLGGIGAQAETWPSTNADLVFSVQSGGSFTERMRLLANGNVGIGTTSPQATLDVNGYMRLSKNSGQPVACSPTNDGAIALTHVYTLCICNGGATSWVQSKDGSTACSW